MENVIKIAVIAVAGALCVVVVKKQAPEIGIVLGVLTGVIVLLFAIPYIKSIIELMKQLAEAANISSAVLTPVIKTIGIAVITKLAAEICKDAKEGGIASFVETSGAAMALVVCAPLIKTVLDMVCEML